MRNNYRFVKFTEEHIDEAVQIARSCYLEECSHVLELPKDAAIPDLGKFAKNELGTAAIEDGKLVGYLCCYTPWDNFFGTSKGTFIPIHAHGSVRANRGKIYSRLYKAVAEVWVSKGILSHAIGIYSHDKEALESFTWNGFGYRTVDAIIPIESINVKPSAIKCEYKELEKGRFHELLGMQNKLINHLNNSPMFVPYKELSAEQFEKKNEGQKARYFIAEKERELIAYIKLSEEGESFVGNHDSVININGAYMKEEYRGSGIYTNLLAYMIKSLKNEKYIRLGVDFETMNPTASGFWMKYFTSYITSVTRRIDERISSFYK